jgi:hypothetical protein
VTALKGYADALTALANTGGYDGADIGKIASDVGGVARKVTGSSLLSSKTVAPVSAAVGALGGLLVDAHVNSELADFVQSAEPKVATLTSALDEYLKGLGNDFDALEKRTDTVLGLLEQSAGFGATPAPLPGCAGDRLSAEGTAASQQAPAQTSSTELLQTAAKADVRGKPSEGVHEKANALDATQFDGLCRTLLFLKRHSDSALAMLFFQLAADTSSGLTDVRRQIDQYQSVLEGLQRAHTQLATAAHTKNAADFKALLGLVAAIGGKLGRSG